MKLNKRALPMDTRGIVSIQSRYQSDAGAECGTSAPPVPSPVVGWLERLESARASLLAAAAPAGRVVRDGPGELPGPSRGGHGSGPAGFHWQRAG
jgi:hypothetical protein